jgi:hypothetical protein
MKTVSNKSRAAILRDLSKLRAEIKKLEATPPPCDPLEAFRRMFRDRSKEHDRGKASDMSNEPPPI